MANVGSRPRVQDSVLAAAAGADDCEGVDFAVRDDPRDVPLVLEPVFLLRS